MSHVEGDAAIMINEPGTYEVNPVQGNTAFALFFDPTGPPPEFQVPGSNYGSVSEIRRILVRSLPHSVLQAYSLCAI